MITPITISVDPSILQLMHYSRCRRGESSASYDATAGRWRAAARQMLRQVGADKDEWQFVEVSTQVSGSRKAVRYRYQRQS